MRATGIQMRTIRKLERYGVLGGASNSCLLEYVGLDRNHLLLLTKKLLAGILDVDENLRTAVYKLQLSAFVEQLNWCLKKMKEKTDGTLLGSLAHSFWLLRK
jgi:hypothetical protein